MRKIKIILFTVLFISNAFITPAMTAWAGNGEDLIQWSKGVEKQLCISNPDKLTYLLAIIEEPLPQAATEEAKGPDGVNPKADCYKQSNDFYLCSCYRNSLTWSTRGKEGKDGNMLPDERKLDSELLTECSTTGKNLQQDYKDKSISTVSPGEIANVYFSCNRVQVLLSKGGTSSIIGYISMIYRWAAGIVGLIAVIVIIISGIQLSVSGGDSNAVESSKKRIIQSIAGIVVLFLSGIILYTINPTFFTAS